MPCFYPLRATQLPGGQITIHKRTPGLPFTPTPAGLGRDIKLPCGRCIGCKLQRAQQWATRCLHESQQHKQNCFLTLTYRDNPNHSVCPEPDSPTLRVDDREIPRDLPTIAQEGLKLRSPNLAHVDNSREKLRSETNGKELSRKDHQKFIKRLRHKCGPLRYYMCGEYGERLSRPHYHYLIFGYNFPDKTYFKTSASGEKLYRSATLDHLWPFGHAWIGDVTYESCAYVAAYVMKKLNGPMAEEHYRRQDEGGNDYWLQPEFNEMSRRPGIAKNWWEEFNPDVYTQDAVVLKNGGLMKPPRYYDKLLEMMDPSAMVLIKHRRELRAKELADDNTPARLADKETVTIAKMALKKRNLENDK